MESDAQTYLQAVVRDRLSNLAMEHNVGRGLRDSAIDRCQRACRLRDRSAALQRGPLGWRGNLSCLPCATFNLVHSAVDGRFFFNYTAPTEIYTLSLPDHPHSVL